MQNVAENKALAAQTINIHGATIEAIRDESGVWIPIRHVCEALGIQPHGQQIKLQAKPWACTQTICVQLSKDTQARDILCLHLDALPMWLATIEASRVRAELRPRLELYQREAARVLREHFFGPVKPREPGDLPPAPPRSPYQDLRFVNIDGWRFLVDRSGVRVCAYDLARKLGWLSPNDLAHHRLSDMESEGQAAAHEVSTGYLFEATALGLAERTMTRPEDVRTVNTMKGHFAFLRHASEPVPPALPLAPAPAQDEAPELSGQPTAAERKEWFRWHQDHFMEAIDSAEAMAVKLGMEASGLRWLALAQLLHHVQSVLVELQSVRFEQEDILVGVSRLMGTKLAVARTRVQGLRDAEKCIAAERAAKVTVAG